jgi:hypothetical protein
LVRAAPGTAARGQIRATNLVAAGIERALLAQAETGELVVQGRVDRDGCLGESISEYLLRYSF